MLHDSQPPKTFGTELSTFHYGSEEQVDGAVCLHKIGEADEKISSEHVFHKGCLDTMKAMCPLCIGLTRPLTQPRAEVLFFQFSAQNNRDRWWLR
ncbi:hypothetical protein Fmac_003036 [Flemingia macrophylla]|uniref:RING-type domain-containing protein n=1 Tax=Flemingia macrophylla TaxID=520843 RepID=A0ABD1NMA1_9FABA